MPGWMKDDDLVPSNTLNIGIPTDPNADDGTAAGRARGKGKSAHAGKGARASKGTGPSSVSAATHLSRVKDLLESLRK